MTCAGCVSQLIKHGRRIFYPMTKAGWDWLLVLETVMLVSFGVAWFVKGTTLPGKTGPG